MTKILKMFCLSRNCFDRFGKLNVLNCDLLGELKRLWQWQDKEGRWRDHAVENSDKIENLYQTRHGKGTVVVESENEK